jgi:hypothetical protein
MTTTRRVHNNEPTSTRTQQLLEDSVDVANLALIASVLPTYNRESCQDSSESWQDSSESCRDSSESCQDSSVVARSDNQFAFVESLHEWNHERNKTNRGIVATLNGSANLSADLSQKTNKASDLTPKIDDHCDVLKQDQKREEVKALHVQKRTMNDR